MDEEGYLLVHWSPPLLQSTSTLSNIYSRILLEQPRRRFAGPDELIKGRVRIACRPCRWQKTKIGQISGFLRLTLVFEDRLYDEAPLFTTQQVLHEARFQSTIDDLYDISFVVQFPKHVTDWTSTGEANSMTRFSYGPGPEHALPPSGNFAESVETYYGCQRAKAKYSLLVKLEMPGLNVAIHDAESVGVSYCPLVDPSSASGLNRLTTLTPQQHLASRNTDDSDGHFRVQSSQLLPEVHRPNSFLETLKRSLSSAPCPIFVFDVEVFLNETLHVSHSPTLRIEINPLLQHESNTCTTIPKIELLSLTFEIKGTTAVWAQNQGASAEKTYYTITEASKPPLTFDARDGYSITWDCTPLAGGLLPSFRTYNIARSYAAHVDVVLSCAGKLVAVSHQRGVVVDVPRREGRARGGEVDLLTGSPRGFEYTDEGSDGGQLPAYSGRHMTRLLEESPSSSTQTTAASDERTSASGKN